MDKALILFAHGARDPEWAGPVQAVAERLRRENSDLPVYVAFLEFMTPTLPDVVAACCHEAPSASGSMQIDVLPFFIAQGGHLRQEVPAMLAALQQQHPNLQLRLLPPLGELPSVQEAMAAAISRLL